MYIKLNKAKKRGKMSQQSSKHPCKHPSFLKRRTFGERAADMLTEYAGSWGFILTFLAFLMLWITVNVWAWIKTWDPYPFILLNLMLSCLAALQAPIILMSQNRAAEHDRINAKYNYQVNRKAEREIRNVQEDLEEIKNLIEGKRRLLKKE